MEKKIIMSESEISLDVDFSFSPAVNAGGKVICMELIPEFRMSETESNVLFPHSFFYSRASLTDKHVLLKLQIETVMQQASFFMANNILCTLNADRDIAGMICAMSEIKTQLITMNNFIRLELTESFSSLSSDASDPLLSVLTHHFGLWLDNFGAGHANLSALQSGLFETVKIDKTFFRKQARGTLWPVVLREIRRYASAVVVDGVENYEQAEHQSFSVEGMQGRLFPSVSPGNPFTAFAMPHNAGFRRPVI